MAIEDSTMYKKAYRALCRRAGGTVTVHWTGYCSKGQAAEETDASRPLMIVWCNRTCCGWFEIDRKPSFGIAEANSSRDVEKKVVLSVLELVKIGCIQALYALHIDQETTIEQLAIEGDLHG